MPSARRCSSPVPPVWHRVSRMMRLERNLGLRVYLFGLRASEYKLGIDEVSLNLAAQPLKPRRPSMAGAAR